MKVLKDVGPCKWAAAFCAAGLLAGNALAYPTNNVTLTFNLTAAHLGPAIPGNFVGLSSSRAAINGAGGYGTVFDPTWNPGASKTTWQQFTNILGQVGIHHLRTICGYSGSDPDPTAAQDNQFFTTLQDSGVTNVIYSLHCYCESDSADNILAASNILANPTDASMLESFALDNEPNFNVNQECPSSPDWTEPEYEVQWNMVYTQTENGLAAAGFQSAPFSGPDDGCVTPPESGTNTPQGWVLRFAGDEAPKQFYTMATQHDYDCADSLTTPDSTGMAVSNLDSARVIFWESVYSNMLEGTNIWPKKWNSNEPLPYRMTEASAFGNGGGNTNGQTFSTALWELDFCHWWAMHGCSGVDPFDRSVDYSAPLYLNWTTGIWTAMPYAYGLLAFNMGANGSPVLASGLNFANPDSINVTAYGVLNTDGHDLYITVVNKTFNAGAAAASVTIPAPANFSTPTAARYLLLSDEPDGVEGNATNLATAYLGGATIPNSGQWNGTWTPLPVNNNGQAAIVVQPATAVVIDLQNYPVLSIGSPPLDAAGFNLQAAGPPGTNVIVQVSTNLMSWTPIYTNSGSFTFTDPNASNTCRFYRLVMP